MMTPPAAAVRFRPTAILLMVLFAVLGVVPGVLMGCGGGAGNDGGGGTVGGSGPAAAPNTVVIKNFAFSPASLTVAPGTKITVINQDQAPHTVTADDKSFDTGTIAGGQRGEFTAPAKPGNHPYVCTIHQYMTGTLTLK